MDASGRELSHYRAKARKGANPLVYWLFRAVVQPFFHLYFRLSRVGREHVPQEGGLIIAANHRSFLDPFVIGTLVRRPIYFVAKKELFEKRFVAWFLNALGAFPIDRGAADHDAMGTARELLERGEVVVIFPEGTRVRPGPPGLPKRGVGRLALETGAPVLPVSVIGTEAIRRGYRIRPHKVRIRCGRPLTFPRVDSPSPELAAAVTERIWPCVELQWEWLGGMPPIRRATVVGAGALGTRTSAALERAGVAVEHAPASTPAHALDLTTRDLLVLAVPTTQLPAVLAAHGDDVTHRTSVLVACDGLGPDGALPTDLVAAGCKPRAIGALARLDADRAVVGSDSTAFVRQLERALKPADVRVERADDLGRLQRTAGAAHDAVRAATPRAVDARDTRRVA